jgi:hypothetical protein
MLHPTAHDRYDKLERVGDRLLNANFNQDDVDDFFAVANSLPEFIRHDPNATAAQRDAAKRLLDDLDWKICHEIANQQKHFRRPTRAGSTLMVKAVSLRRGAGGVFDVQRRRVFAAGDDICFVQADGTERSAFAVVWRMLTHFRYIFQTLPGLALKPTSS